MIFYGKMATLIDSTNEPQKRTDSDGVYIQLSVWCSRVAPNCSYYSSCL
jgi:hypothetical protein